MALPLSPTLPRIQSVALMFSEALHLSTYNKIIAQRYQPERLRYSGRSRGAEPLETCRYCPFLSGSHEAWLENSPVPGHCRNALEMPPQLSHYTIKLKSRVEFFS